MIHEFIQGVWVSGFLAGAFLASLIWLMILMLALSFRRGK